MIENSGILPLSHGPLDRLMVNRFHGTLTLLGEGGDALFLFPLNDISQSVVEAMGVLALAFLPLRTSLATNHRNMLA
jgi:hypothetical protein